MAPVRIEVGWSVAYNAPRRLSARGETTLEKRVFVWHGQEFVALSDEGRSGGSAHDQTRDILERMDLALRREETSLIGTVRTRLWARDRSARDRGSRARVDILSDYARSASSSYIAPDHFETSASIAIDLVAMKPASGMVKDLVEYDPPITPLRYVVYGPLVHLSGVTSVLGTFEAQVTEILPKLGESLTAAGSSWAHATKVSFYVHREASVDELKALFVAAVSAPDAELEYGTVDGYSTLDKLVEIEVTATV